MPYILIAALLALGLFLLVLAIRRRRGEEHEPNYRTFFLIGIIWLPIGIATENPGLWGMGAVFLIAGLLHRGKWREERKWSELSDSERRFKLMLVFGLLALVVWYLAGSGAVRG